MRAEYFAGRRRFAIALIGPAVAAFILLDAVGAEQAQIEPQSPLRFEVVSIRPLAEDGLTLIQSGRMHRKIDDSRVDFGAVNLLGLIRFAYATSDDYIVGPKWLVDLHFDIVAKIPEGVSKSRAPEMVRAMLADRFHFAAHLEQRVVPVYELRVGKPPLKLTRSPDGDSPQVACVGGPPPEHHVCRKVSMAHLASFLTLVAGASKMTGFADSGIDRRVVDRTGLEGPFDFDLDYGRAFAGGSRSEALESPGNAVYMSVKDGLAQLGLKLEPARMPVDHVVVDRIEKLPTEN